MAIQSLSKEELHHLAKLTNISLTDEETKTYGDQLGEIIGYVDQLKEVDVSAVESTSSLTGTSNITEEDVVDEKRQLTSLENLKTTDVGGKQYFKVGKLM